MPRLIRRPPRRQLLLMTPNGTLDGFSLKSIGKAISNAVKPKNLLKTAAIAAAAYGGYKLATSPSGSSVLKNLGSGLKSLGSGLVKAVPAVVGSAAPLVSSVLAYKAASQPAAEYPTGELLPNGALIYPGTGPTALPGTLPANYPGTYPAEAYAPQSQFPYPSAAPASSMPGWLLPAALGAGLLVVVMATRK